MKIQKVAFENDYIVHIILNTGKEECFNMKPRLVEARFMELNDVEKFKHGELVNEKIIHWSDITEITLAELLVMKEEKE